MTHVYELRDGVGPSYVGELDLSRTDAMRLIVSKGAAKIGPPRAEPLIGQPHAGAIWLGNFGFGIGAQELHETMCGDRRRLSDLRRLQKIGAA